MGQKSRRQKSREGREAEKEGQAGIGGGARVHIHHDFEYDIVERVANQ